MSAVPAMCLQSTPSFQAHSKVRAEVLEDDAALEDSISLGLVLSTVVILSQGASMRFDSWGIKEVCVRVTLVVKFILSHSRNMTFTHSVFLCCQLLTVDFNKVEWIDLYNLVNPQLRVAGLPCSLEVCQRWTHFLLAADWLMLSLCHFWKWKNSCSLMCQVFAVLSMCWVLPWRCQGRRYWCSCNELSERRQLNQLFSIQLVFWQFVGVGLRVLCLVENRLLQAIVTWPNWPT